jgi:RHS repeat-associated protein
MKTSSRLILSTSPQTRPARKPRLTTRSLYRRTPRRYTGKEQDSETGLHYYGARYLDSRTGRWLSGDPAVSDYIPSAPVNDEAKKQNESLPGMGGVFNYANLHIYHYAGNNPVRYTDPDGEASILTRLINRGVKKYYDAANSIGKATGWEPSLHSLVDMGDLNSVSRVYQYSGRNSGFTENDNYSNEKTYRIVYSGMDDSLTERAVEKVKNRMNFGSGNNEKAKKWYVPFLNDCNDFTDAVFNEYSRLWKEDFAKNNEDVNKHDIDTAWNEHLKDISKDRGKEIEIRN